MTSPSPRPEMVLPKDGTPRSSRAGVWVTWFLVGLGFVALAWVIQHGSSA